MTGFEKNPHFLNMLGLCFPPLLRKQAYLNASTREELTGLLIPISGGLWYKNAMISSRVVSLSLISHHYLFT
jgi:hypothetical protein